MKYLTGLFAMVLALVLFGTGFSVYALQDGSQRAGGAYLFTQSETELHSNHNLRLQQMGYNCLLADSFVCHQRVDLSEVQ